MIKKKTLRWTEWIFSLVIHSCKKQIPVYFICTYMHVQSEHDYNFLGEDFQVQPHSVSIAVWKK